MEEQVVVEVLEEEEVVVVVAAAEVVSIRLARAGGSQCRLASRSRRRRAAYAPS